MSEVQSFAANLEGNMRRAASLAVSNYFTRYRITVPVVDESKGEDE